MLILSRRSRIRSAPAQGGEGGPMRCSPGLLATVEAALPPPDRAGIAASQVHGRVPGAWNRTTIRHALRALVQSGRASFTGVDRHRKYRLAGAAPPGAADGAPACDAVDAAAASPPAFRPERGRWRDYALRGDGSVRPPDEAAVAALMRRHGVRYADASAADLRHEERLPGWSRRKPTSAELTRAVFGDPAPGRRGAERVRPSSERSRP